MKITLILLSIIGGLISGCDSIQELQAQQREQRFQKDMALANKLHETYGSDPFPEFQIGMKFSDFQKALEKANNGIRVKNVSECPTTASVMYSRSVGVGYGAHEEHLILSLAKNKDSEWIIVGYTK